VALLLCLVERADALLEGFRPGVMERLGLGPAQCLARNPRLVYGRMTGWGQHGPLAQAAGHDLNYLALSGALHAIGTPDAPSIPLNLVADFGGGGMLLAFGLLCALLEAQRSGRGQVVDAAMTDGAALLMTMIYQLRGLGAWRDERGANLLDGAAPFYTTYACADGQWLAVAAIEPLFFRRLLERAGIAGVGPEQQWDRAAWPELQRVFAAHFRTRTRDAWVALLAEADCCVSPVLSMDEAPQHPHNQARGTFSLADGMPTPAPAPRLSRTPAALAQPAQPATAELLAAWGVGDDALAAL
jgi:alpha-methylacyl-CoA racemase